MILIFVSGTTIPLNNNKWGMNISEQRHVYAFRQECRNYFCARVE